MSSFQKWRGQKTRVCGWKEINRRSRQGNEGERWEERWEERKWPEEKD